MTSLRLPPTSIRSPADLPPISRRSPAGLPPISQVEALLPVVEATHAPYLGFKAGDTINDHDLALGYVLDFHASLLPSFAELTVADQHTVRFTQSKMSFNHGWLVQGEAPPSPLFAKFKQVRRLPQPSAAFCSLSQPSAAF